MLMKVCANAGDSRAILCRDGEPATRPVKRNRRLFFERFNIIELLNPIS